MKNKEYVAAAGGGAVIATMYFVVGKIFGFKLVNIFL